MKSGNKFRLILVAVVWPLLLHSQTNTFDTLYIHPGKGKIVFIQWSVAPQADSLHYEVERSSDTVIWLKIASVNSTKTSHQYFYIDPDPRNGINYYRVKQVGHDKTFSRSAIKWIQISKVSKIYIWPNPASNVLHIKTPFSNGSLEIIDGSGKLVLNAEITDYVMHISTDRFPAGVYFIHIRNGCEILTEKFSKN